MVVEEAAAELTLLEAMLMNVVRDAGDIAGAVSATAGYSIIVQSTGGLILYPISVR